MIDLEAKLSALAIERPAALTVGTFDGVHLGHRMLLGTLRGRAATAGLFSVAVTFRSQPRSLIDPNAATTYLSTIEHRISLVAETGVQQVLPVEFDEALRMLTADEFLGMLKRASGVKMLVLGLGARLGHDRLNANEIAPLASKHGIELIEVEPERIDGQVVSSSAIRKSLAAGDVTSAARMLGRRYRLDGTVVSGDRRGRELGFPTANIEPSGAMAIPVDGIYATLIRVRGEWRKAATSIGVRPTFGGGARLVEAFILDFNGDLYGQDVQLEFVKRLRGEVKFEGVDPLIEQMHRDVSEARDILSSAV
jgi:riboflavin kinase/FMN adenylyltransferase